MVASIVIAAGAVPIGLLANSRYGQPPNLNAVLIGIGVFGIAAWLIDGRRYVAPGSAALGVGMALALGQRTTIDPYALIFGFIGMAMLLLSRVNPQAVAAAGGFLIYLASVVGFSRANDTAPKPWLFPLIMMAWGGIHLVRIVQASPHGFRRAGSNRTSFSRHESAAGGRKRGSHDEVR